jgi:nitrogen-specific signal transduction histidine kinase/CheY-like chemotaxis protein
VSRVAGISDDITEERRRDEERRQIEEQLAQSHKLDAIGQLAGGVAHDFNNQLAGIMGFAELLREEVESDAKLLPYVDYILNGTRRSAELTGKLLAFARKGKYQTMPVNLHKVIGEVVSLLKHSVDKRIRIVQDLKAEPPVVLGDPTQLQNAILNLALNARDAMPQGGTLSLRTRNTTLDGDFCRSVTFDVTPGHYICVSVEDTGVGMDEELLKRVFEPFFTTKDEGRGTGMGLASVYGTVTNHRGAVTVRSTPGKGSTFEAFLPAAVEETVAITGGKETTVRGNARILVVDDEETFRDLAVASLKSLGYEVVTCADGVSAVDYYRAASKLIDLVMLDIVMPGMDGRETYNSLREINPDVKAILCSGYSKDGRAQEILDDGAMGFVQKPFRRAELSRLLAGVLGSSPNS